MNSTIFWVLISIISLAVGVGVATLIAKKKIKKVNEKLKDADLQASPKPERDIREEINNAKEKTRDGDQGGGSENKTDSNAEHSKLRGGYEDIGDRELCPETTSELEGQGSLQNEPTFRIDEPEPSSEQLDTISEGSDRTSEEGNQRSGFTPI